MPQRRRSPKLLLALLLAVATALLGGKTQPPTARPLMAEVTHRSTSAPTDVRRPMLTHSTSQLR